MRRRIFRLTILIGAVLSLLPPLQAHAQRLTSPQAGVWYDPALDGGRAAYSEPLRRSLSWKTAGPGVSLAELDISIGAGPLRIHTILVRIRLDSLRADLVQLTDPAGMRGVWTIDSAGPAARVAINAGQFMETGPWGWIVSSGHELAGPRTGPLAGAIAFDSAGHVRWYTDTGVASVRSRKNDIVTAFQSWPRLLDNGVMPAAVRTGRGMDARHRDARLAIGELANHELLIALTRFGARESVISRVPIGLTTRETAALMRALGCSNALMLDGGLSAQMVVASDSTTSVLRSWHGARRVPVALIFRSR